MQTRQLVRPLPDDILDDAVKAPSILGVPAHRPFSMRAGADSMFPIRVDGKSSPQVERLPADTPADLAWDKIGATILGRPPKRTLRYTLLDRSAGARCPFYINYGFLAGPPKLLMDLYRGLCELHGPIAGLIGNGFYGQVAIAMTVEKFDLPWRALPLRFNFPNDRIADKLHPDDLAEVVLLHYLRTSRFDRHLVFAEKDAFDAFISRVLIGSDRVFQEHVWRITRGKFPFSAPGRYGMRSRMPIETTSNPKNSKGMDWERFYATYPLAFGPSEHLKQAGHTIKGNPISNEQFQLIAENTGTLLNLAKDDVVLDLCCGNGVFTKEHAKRCDRVVGIDFSKPLLNVAERDHCAENLSYYRMNALDVRPGGVMSSFGFNKVIMCGALQHFEPHHLEPLLENLVYLTSEERIILFYLVPDRRKKWTFYDTIAKRSGHVVRQLMGKERMGRWWHPRDFEETCGRLGLTCSFFPMDERLHASCYRFHIKIT